MAARRVVHEEVVAGEEIEPVERSADARGVGEGRHHVGAEQEEHAHAPVLERLRHPGHLTGHVVPGRAALARGDAREALSVRGSGVSRPETAAGDAEVSGERGKAGHRAGALPAVRAFVHGAAAEDDHRGLRRRVTAREGDDAIAIHSCRCGGPGDVIFGDVRSERVETERVARDESRILQPLRDDDLHHAEGESCVRPRPDEQRFVGIRRRLGAPHVDGDDVRAAPFGRCEMARRVRLAGEICSPEEDQRSVSAHVLFGVCLQHAGEAQPE